MNASRYSRSRHCQRAAYSKTLNDQGEMNRAS